MAFAMLPVSFGSTKIPAEPTTSGSDEELEAITGTPFAMASKAGKPKPSVKDGKTRTERPRKSSAGRRP